MKKIIVLILLLSLVPLIQAQGDYNSGLQAGLKAGYAVVQAMLQKDDAAYNTAAQAWNGLVETAFGGQASAYTLATPLKQNSTTRGVDLGGLSSEGMTTVLPSHQFDAPMVIGKQESDWQPSSMILGGDRPKEL